MIKPLTMGLIVIPVVVLTAAPAWAYVDPGVGGMFYQLVILAAAAVGGFFAVFKTKLKNKFRGRKTDQTDPGNDSPTE